MTDLYCAKRVTYDGDTSTVLSKAEPVAYKVGTLLEGDPSFMPHYYGTFDEAQKVADSHNEGRDKRYTWKVYGIFLLEDEE